MSYYEKKIEHLKKRREGNNKKNKKRYRKCYPTDEEIAEWYRKIDEWEKEQRDEKKKSGWGWWSDSPNDPVEWDEELFQWAKEREKEMLYHELKNKPTPSQVDRERREKRNLILRWLGAAVVLFVIFFPGWLPSFAKLDDFDKMRMFYRVYNAAGIAESFKEGEKIGDSSLKRNLSSSLYEDYAQGNPAGKYFVFQLKAWTVRTWPTYEIVDIRHGKDIFGKEYGKVTIYSRRDNRVMRALAWFLGAYPQAVWKNHLNKYTFYLVKEKHGWKIDNGEVTNIAEGICLVPRAAELAASGEFIRAAETYIKFFTHGEGWEDEKRDGVFVFDFDPKAKHMSVAPCLLGKDVKSAGMI
ncbi:hypothetical protein [Hydrogenimonas cancrithermarum]|uniref:Uncharacterized protein n=1 Tax=Hydrogenimonas cancrithermarum TaxID=2993563 RepID=A0ABN6WXF3_9BACT|nr:hypothetical protein [Hydrogenimonas cancrithermarum]BDY13986.1 hypothetical protein HCR_22990 [Hydrogenimonas cancrithermarum]